MAMLRGKRGAYKLYLQDPSRAIPKQTLSNWRKKEACDRDEDPSQVPQSLMPLLLCICERFLLVDEFVRVDLNASILYWVVSGVQISSLHSFSISAPF